MEGVEVSIGRMLRGRRAAALMLLAVLATAGCTGSPDPATTAAPAPSTSSSPATSSPTATATPSESSTIPEEATKNTPEGAEAFVRYFMDRVNLAWTTPTTGVIAEEGTTDCKFCKATEETAEWLVSHGQRYARDPVTLAEVTALAGAPEGQIYLAVEMVQNSSDIVDANNVPQSTESRKELHRNVALRWRNGRWYMFAVEKAA